MELNNVTVVGKVSRISEVRYTRRQDPVVNLSLAVNRTWHSRETNQLAKKTTYIDVACWGLLAHNVARTIKRGMRVVVVGRLEADSWPAKDGETTQQQLKLQASEVSPSLRHMYGDLINVSLEDEGYDGDDPDDPNRYDGVAVAEALVGSRISEESF